MSTNELDHLEFRGRDLKECEQFIAAVNKHARAEGKLRDDQWVADFVATCLAEDALIWWSLLDEDTQGSWRLLRKEMISRFRLLFHWKSGTEAEDFVYQIRQRALREGKLNDPQWTAEVAQGCFVGSALRWYLSLDPSVRGDWDSLQQAILVQYSQGSETSPATIIPTPALAATAPVPTKRRHKGRIRVRRQNDSGVYYLSYDLNMTEGSEGSIGVTSAVVWALEVEYDPASASNGLQTLIIPRDQIKGFNLLGIKWYGVDTTLSDNSLYPCGVDSSSGKDSIFFDYCGPCLTAAWEISLSENEEGARSVIPMDGPGRRLLTLSKPKTPGYIWFKRTKDTREIDVDLFFEPV